MLGRYACRLTPQFSGRALPFEARRERIMKWRARAVAAPTYHGPLQLLVRRLAPHVVALVLGDALAARLRRSRSQCGSRTLSPYALKARDADHRPTSHWRCTPKIWTWSRGERGDL